MKNLFLITLTILVAMTSIQCPAQTIIQPNRPSAEGQQAIRDLLDGNRQTGNANAKGDDAYLELVAKVLKNDSSLPSPNCMKVWTKDARAFENKPLGSQTAAPNSQTEVRNDECKRFVRIKTNHRDGKFEEGDLMVLEVVTDLDDANIYIVNQRPDGTFYVIYPKEHDDPKPVKAGEKVFYPAKGAEYEIETQAPFGEEKIIAIASKQKLDLKQLENPAFYAQRGLLKGDDAKNFERVEKVNISADDFPCQTITVTSYAKGQRPSASPKQRWVLVVSVPFYQSERFRPIPACLNDLQLLTGIFLEYGKVDGIVVLAGKEVTKKNLHEAFATLVEKTNPGDEVFIVWTGHGCTISDTTGKQPTGKTGCLVLYDSKPGDQASLFTDVEFEHMLDNLDERRIAIFLDACVSEHMIDADYNFFANKSARFEDSKDIRPDQAAVLCSSATEEISWVVANNKTPFSVMLMCVARCILENEKAVSFDDICEYVAINVPPLVKKRHGFVQTPVYMNQIGPIFVKP